MPRAQAERAWLVGGALAAFVLLAVGYFFFVSPARGHTSDVNARADAALTQNQALQARIDTLRAQSANLDRYRAAVKAAELALPRTSGLPEFLRTLQSLGAATLTSVSSLTVGTPTPLSPPSAAPAAGSASATPSPTPTSTPTQPGTPPVAAAGASIYTMPVTAQVSGKVSGLEKFLTQLQSVQPRAVLINQVSLTDAANGAARSGAAMTLTMQIFVAPASTPASSTPTP